MEVLVVWFIFWAGFGGLIGYAIGSSKGRGTEGFWLGFLLGFIGWIVVALMEPTDDIQQQRVAALAAVMQPAISSAAIDPGSKRECPWCAEQIKPAARVCRFCGRDVEPIANDVAVPVAEDLEPVRADYPVEFELAAAHLRSLPKAPFFPARWVRELCKRMHAGSPSEAAATRIPLDWNGPPPLASRPLPRVVIVGDPERAGEFGAVAHEYPASYDQGRAILAGLTEPPAHPEVWLRELCRRIEAGSPPQAAASRIPLDLT